ncbi:monovalent cation/H(+) antiporter subunit G [Halodurantibacterium flavum]|uniref:Monovalent cation/H(+) antiporter subunit G n=1 Tax=Halodurantibacterium flavum TaxID=1382802 RepID=A0ABW4S8Z3_9RHOB
MNDILTILLTGLGLVFFLAGTMGLIRFPDSHSRLHALTKADNLGLGLLVLGLAFQADGWMTLGKLVIVWVLALVAAGTTAQLVARSALGASARGFAGQHAPGRPE